MKDGSIPPSLEPSEPRRVLRQTLLTRRPRFFDAQLVLLWLGLMIVSSWSAWSDARLIEWGATIGPRILESGEVWRLITAQFLHSDLGHLLSNGYMIFILGLFVHAYFGWQVFPLAALGGGALVNLLTIASYPPEARLLGASGVVYWLAGFWLVLFLLIERQRSWPRRLLRVAGVGLLILFPSEFQPNVSYLAHSWGLILGVLSGVIFFVLRFKWIRSFEVFDIEYGG
ncbi:MAG: rhomboid family intramembrane serine protease [Bdellovibrionaceae bacterium]|nr:rhomboid family intramembrane serine protease [Bdellovibrionales bacterium]MCB9084028.1 rhomboid family intramembrane serine protease [Pseudobdellovibrionaceae bacterium]